MNIQDIKNNIFKSSAIGLSRVFIAIPIYLILTPFILNMLGSEDFAIWSFSTIIISLISLGDFGFKNSLIYHLANNIKSTQSQNTYFNNALFIFIIVAITIVCTTYIFAPQFSQSILNIEKEHIDKTSFVLSIIALSFAFRFISTPYQAVIEAHQKIYFTHYTMIIWLISNFILSIIVLSIKPSIYYLGIASLIPNLFVLIMFIYKTKKDHPYINLDISLFDIKCIKGMIKYGSGIHIATIAIALREPLLKILIARNADLLAVTIFELSYRLSVQAISITKTPLQSVFSASALLSNDKEKINEILPPFCNYNIATLIPSCIFFFYFSSEIINLWLGSGHDKTAEVLPLIYMSFCIYYLTEPLYKTIEASGKSFYSAAIQLTIIGTCYLSFFYLKDQNYLAPSYVLIITFSVFSFINFILFKIVLKSVKTFEYIKSTILFLLGGMYIILLTDDTYTNILMFISYIFIHFVLCRSLKIFDIFNILRKLYQLILKQ